MGTEAELRLSRQMDGVGLKNDQTLENHSLLETPENPNVYVEFVLFYFIGGMICGT